MKNNKVNLCPCGFIETNEPHDGYGQFGGIDNVTLLLPFPLKIMPKFVRKAYRLFNSWLAVKIVGNPR